MKLFGRREDPDDPAVMAQAAFTTVREAQYDAAIASAHAEALAAVAEAMANTMARNGGNNPLTREARKMVASWRAHAASRTKSSA